MRRSSLLFLLLLAGCATLREPTLPALRDVPDKMPVVFIPGITGNQLRDRVTKHVLWGSTLNFVLPADGGYALARPLDLDSAEHDRVEAFAPILDVKLFGVLRALDAYGSVARLMKKNGYTPGDLHDPKPGENFFFFVYDWRQDNVATARELARQLDRLRAVRGEEKLKVALVCQSNGGNVARYFLKYGGASLDEAEGGTAQPPAGIDVQKLVLIATANGASLRTLHEMDRGREYLRMVGRDLLPETLFTFPSLYEDLPVYRRDLFFDKSGQLMDVDLFDAANWMKFGWSIYGREAQARLRHRPRPQVFFDEARRAEFLRQCLGNAQRFRQALDRDVPKFEATRYYALQNLYTPTPERAMLVQRKGQWRTVFLDDDAVRRDPYLMSLASSPGDGHATLDSQLRLSPQERKALAHPPVYVAGGHFEIVLNPATQQRLLEFLAE